ncbi:MAG TPA: hypothetical protein VIU13_15465 [Chryseolinea sp.]
MIRTTLLALSAATAAGILFVNVYNSVIDANNWGASLPDSITTARQYFAVANPGNFFRIVSPLNQALALAAVILCWKHGRARYFALGSLALAVSADVLTFGYFYPRLDVMFTGPIEYVENIRVAWQQWATMNWLRSAMCGVNTVFAFTILVTTSKNLAA